MYFPYFRGRQYELLALVVKKTFQFIKLILKRMYLT